MSLSIWSLWVPPPPPQGLRIFKKNCPGVECGLQCLQLCRCDRWTILQCQHMCVCVCALATPLPSPPTPDSTPSQGSGFASPGACPHGAPSAGQLRAGLRSPTLGSRDLRATFLLCLAEPRRAAPQPLEAAWGPAR